jgi:hypothetical protein
MHRIEGSPFTCIQTDRFVAEVKGDQLVFMNSTQFALLSLQKNAPVALNAERQNEANPSGYAEFPFLPITPNQCSEEGEVANTSGCRPVGDGAG